MKAEHFRKAQIKDIGPSRNARAPRVLIERTHLMRVDGIERMNSVKTMDGPVSGYLEAVARTLALTLSKRPEALTVEDLQSPELRLIRVDRQMRRVANAVSRRARLRHNEGSDAYEAFRTDLRQRIVARMLYRLPREFVVAANRLIQQEAQRHEATVWL